MPLWSLSPPDVRAAGLEAHGPVAEHYVASLRELLGLVGAHEWRKKGVPIPALGANIHAHYGVFSPVRGEYIDLVAQAPLPATTLAFDIGTGTGVLAALLARRGVQQVLATDQDPRALACARDNLQRLALASQVQVLHNQAWEWGGVRFLGSTLWSDFRAAGDGAAQARVGEQLRASARKVLDGEGQIRVPISLPQGAMIRWPRWWARAAEFCDTMAARGKRCPARTGRSPATSNGLRFPTDRRRWLRRHPLA